MLTHLRIKNFKGWRDTGAMRMAPLTLLFGANSSGKSSIGQFLLLLKQTVESPDRRVTLFAGNDQSPVQFGSVSEMVHGRDAKGTIEFEYRWRLPQPLQFTDPVHGKAYKGDELSFFSTVAGQGAKPPILKGMLHRLSNENGVEMGLGLDIERSDYALTAENYVLKRTQGAAAPYSPVNFYGFSNEVSAYHQNADIAQALNFEHQKLFGGMYYLGPLRTEAKRVYGWSGESPSSVGRKGEDAIATILAGEERKIIAGRQKGKGKGRAIQAILADNLRGMGLIEEFAIKPIQGQPNLYQVKVRPKGDSTLVDLPDVGVGVAQVLPVLAQCYYASANSIIIMEQPEIHLHPSAQSALADVIIDVLKSRERGRNRNIQLIIETHSEHFLLRLQRRIAEKAISQEMVQAYFASHSGANAALEPLEVDVSGNIRNWPENFFGDRIGDIVAQNSIALQMNTRGAKR